MGKRYTTEEFIDKAKTVHGDKYDYTLVDYKGSKDKVIIVCDLHGEFVQTPNHHLKGRGCPACGYSHITELNKKRHDSIRSSFIERSCKIHNNRYKYLSDYVDSYTKIKIECLECGYVFEQKPHNHLNGQGCPHCNRSKGELSIGDWLSCNDFEYFIEKTFDDCRGIKRPLPFDFWIPSKNILIEFQGRHHYDMVNFKGSLTNEQMETNYNTVKCSDTIKRQYCVDNGIELLEIPYWDINNIDKILMYRLGE